MAKLRSPALAAAAALALLALTAVVIASAPRSVGRAALLSKARQARVQQLAGPNAVRFGSMWRRQAADSPSVRHKPARASHAHAVLTTCCALAARCPAVHGAWVRPCRTGRLAGATGGGGARRGCVGVTGRAAQEFGVYASSVKNTIPTSRGFDFYTYANEDPYVEPGNEPDADKFNARALRSFEALMKRAERLEKLVRVAACCRPLRR